MEHRSWNDTTAADVISDILKMKEYAECASDASVKQFFEKGDKRKSNTWNNGL